MRIHQLTASIQLDTEDEIKAIAYIGSVYFTMKVDGVIHTDPKNQTLEDCAKSLAFRMMKLYQQPE